MEDNVKQVEIILCGKPVTVNLDFETWCVFNDKEDLLEEWDKEKNSCSPNTKSYGSQYKAAWKCAVCGHEWVASIVSRTSGRGCPNCFRNAAQKEKIDLETWCKVNNRNTLLDEWDYGKNSLEPKKIKAKSLNKAWWKCEKCGASYESRVYDRIKDHGCPVCAGCMVQAGINDLETWCLKNGKKNILDEWSPENTILPTQVTPGSDKRVLWACSTCGHKWSATVASRKRGGGCPTCGRHVATVGINDFRTWCLANGKEKLLKEWSVENTILPSQLSRGSAKHIVWVCLVCGRKWSTSLDNRSRGTGCPYCAGKHINRESVANKPINEKKDLVSWCVRNRKRKILEEWDAEKNDCSPNSKSYGSAYRAAWKCSECNYEWIASINSRTSGSGCPSCGIKRRAESRKLNRMKSK